MVTKKNTDAPTLPRIDTSALRRSSLSADQWRGLAVMLAGQRNELADLLEEAWRHGEEMTLNWVAQSDQALRASEFTKDLVRFVLDCRAADEAAKLPHKTRAAQVELLKFFDRLSVAYCANDLRLAYPGIGKPRTAGLPDVARPGDKEVIDWYVAQVRAAVGRKRMSADDATAMSKTFRNRLSIARKALNPEKA